MLILSFLLAVVIEIAFPIFLAFWITRRFKTDPLLIGVGAGMFILSQIFHLPLVAGLTLAYQKGGIQFPPGVAGRVLNALLLGFLAGVFEEPARWLGFKLLKSKADSWEAAIALGTGHGGIESVALVGFSVLASLGVMLLIRYAGISVPGITETQVAQFWDTPWHLPLAGAVERLMAILLHISLSTLVWLSIRRHSLGWLLAAIAWHTVIDFGVVFASSSGWGVWAIEGLLAVISVLNVGIIRFTHR